MHTIQDIVDAHTDSPSLREILSKIMIEKLQNGFDYKEQTVYLYEDLFLRAKHRWYGIPLPISAEDFIQEALNELYKKVYTEYCIPF